MKDIKYKNNDFQFTARASALIFNNEEDKILLFNVEGRNFYILVGGKIQELEESKDAIKREIKEELGWENFDCSFLGISEEFVNDKGCNNHQLNLIYKIIYKDKIIEKEFKGLDGDWSNFKWINISDIHKYDIYPKDIKQIINEPNKVYHFTENLIVKGDN